MSRVQSIERAFAVLDALVDGPLGVPGGAAPARGAAEGGGGACGVRLRGASGGLSAAVAVSPNPVQVRDWTGSRIPMHAVSSRQVFLAHQAPSALDRESTRLNYSHT